MPRPLTKTIIRTIPTEFDEMDRLCGGFLSAASLIQSTHTHTHKTSLLSFIHAAPFYSIDLIISVLLFRTLLVLSRRTVSEMT